jgi:hypothetical protein
MLDNRYARLDGLDGLDFIINNFEFLVLNYAFGISKLREQKAVKIA